MALASIIGLMGSTAALSAASFPPPPAARELRDTPGAAADALRQSALALAGPQFTAEGPARLFEVPAEVSWQQVVKGLSEERPLQGNARMVKLEGVRAGHDRVELFDLGQGRALVVAMAGDPGRPGLVGYFPGTLTPGTLEDSARAHRDPATPR